MKLTMNKKTFTVIVPICILAIAVGASNAQKDKKQVNAEKIYYLDESGELKNGRILDVRNI